MATNRLFDVVTEAMEADTGFSRLEARGTLRIALKISGLDADTIQPDQMRVVLARILPKELAARGVDAPEALCDRLVEVVNRADRGGAITRSDAPEDVFRRTRGERT
jgi:hypothetical protein